MKTNISTSPKAPRSRTTTAQRYRKTISTSKIDEEQGHLVEPDGKLRVRLLDGQHAALVRHVFFGREGTAPDPVGHQEDRGGRPDDQKEVDKHGKGSCHPVKNSPVFWIQL